MVGRIGVEREELELRRIRTGDAATGAHDVPRAGHVCVGDEAKGERVKGRVNGLVASDRLIAAHAVADPARSAYGAVDEQSIELGLEFGGRGVQCGNVTGRSVQPAAELGQGYQRVVAPRVGDGVYGRRLESILRPTRRVNQRR